MNRTELPSPHILPVFHRPRSSEVIDSTCLGGSAGIQPQRTAIVIDREERRAPISAPKTFAESSQWANSEEDVTVAEVPEPGERWTTGREEFSHMPPDKDVALQNCSTLVYKHDNNRCQSWRDEIESFMVFAGLFSAVLTAFIMESYKWLMVEPDDISADYLRQILALLSHVDVAAVKTVSRTSPLPSDVTTRINAFWFSSLTLSLTSALVGIVSKQWLREFLRDTGHSHQTNLAVRQVKHEGLTKWYVGAVIAAIPLLLQTALFLFLAGVIDLLWHLQKGVAVLISIICSSTMLFFIVTTVLPGIQYIRHHRGLKLHAIYQVPFKSPQAWVFMQGAVAFLNFFAWAHAYVLSLCRRGVHEHDHVAPYRTHATWTEFDLDWTRRHDLTAAWNDVPVAMARCLGFIQLTFEHASLRDWIWTCLWQIRNKAVNARYVLQCFRGNQTDKLDLTSPDDRLIDDVKYVLDPAGTSEITSESIMHALLYADWGIPRVEARLEHIIRLFNTFCMRKADDTPRRIDTLLRNTLQDLAHTSTSPDLRQQLYYIAQDLLQRGVTTDADSSFRWLQLAYEIVDHLSRNEARDGDSVSTVFSLDFVGEIAEWIDAQSLPTTDKDLSDYKARVVWAAQISVLLARRFLKLGPLDGIAAWHPRFAEIHDLVQRVYTKTLSMPQEMAPAWRMGWFSLDEFTLVRAALDARLEAEKNVGGRRKRKPSAKRQVSQRTDSSGTYTESSESTALDCGNARLSDELQDGQRLRKTRSPSPSSTPEPDTRAVHWNPEPLDSQEKGNAEEARIGSSSRETSPTDEPRRQSPDRGRGTRSEDRSSSSSPASAGAGVGEVAMPHPDVVIHGDGVLAEGLTSPSRARFKED